MTCQMVAAAMGVPLERRLGFEMEAPEATAEELESLPEKTQRSCAVLQALVAPRGVETTFTAA